MMKFLMKILWKVMVGILMIQNMDLVVDVF